MTRAGIQVARLFDLFNIVRLQGAFTTGTMARAKDKSRTALRPISADFTAGIAARAEDQVARLFDFHSIGRLQCGVHYLNAWPRTKCNVRAMVAGSRSDDLWCT